MARPRQFNPDEALEKVTDVFWRFGFEGASLQDIEAATGLNKQSLYRIFPDKRAMYLASLKFYEATEVNQAAAVLARPGGAKTRFARLFDDMIARISKGDRRGCFLCSAAAEQSQLDDATRAFVSGALERVETMFATSLAASPRYKNDEGARQAKAAELLAIYFGIRVLTRANSPVATIRAAADQALASI